MNSTNIFEKILRIRHNDAVYEVEIEDDNMTITKVYDFDTTHDRSNTSSIKWTKRKNRHGDLVPLEADAISLWVAEMEFPNPPEIREAMKRRIDHGFFGYTSSPEPLKEVIVERMKALYGWKIEKDWILFNPGMVMYLGIIARALTKAGDGILINTPVYGPFISRPVNYERFAQKVPLVRVDDDANTFHYEIDFDSFESAITSQTSMYYLCNPHNPLGKSFSREELERLADICLKHDVIIASDDIHSDLMLGDATYTPISTLSPEVEKNTIMMIAGTKTFNMAGIACSVAIIPDAKKRQLVDNLANNSGYHTDVLAYEALLAGYRDCDEWLYQVKHYLRENRDFLTQYIRENLPEVKTTVPDATYMSWLDFNDVAILSRYESVDEFLAKEAGVAVNPGSFFGDNLNSYIRLNFACPRSMLHEGLDRIRDAVNRL